MPRHGEHPFPIALTSLDPGTLEAACRAFVDGDRARGRTLLGASVCKGDSWMLERWAKAQDLQNPGIANACNPPAQVMPYPELRDLAREGMQLALEVHDAASSARWSAVLKHLEAEAARGAPTSDALDLTRLTDAEADALEYLCEVARGNRPAPGDAKWARWVAAISR